MHVVAQAGFASSLEALAADLTKAEDQFSAAQTSLAAADIAASPSGHTFSHSDNDLPWIFRVYFS